MFVHLYRDRPGHIVCNDVPHICLSVGLNDNPLSPRSNTMFTQPCCDRSGHIVCNDVPHICISAGLNDNPLSL